MSDSSDTKETFLYRVEAELQDGRLLTVIVAAYSDQQAFHHAENHLLRHTVAPPRIDSLSLVEKKPFRRGAGYVFETAKEGF